MATSRGHLTEESALLYRGAASMPVVGGGTFESHRGLSSQEAESRLLAHGPNKLDPPEVEGFLSIVATQMKSTIFILTLTAAFIGWEMGEHAKPRILVGLVVFVCGAKAVAEYSGQDAGRALASMTASAAAVIRDGKEMTIDQEHLVVGDVVKLKIGDMVPADMLVLESVGLQTNEAVLTGEPDERNKTVKPRDLKANFLSNMLYKGTSVVGGHGVGEVVATGMQTQLGLIAKTLRGTALQELSPLQESINSLGVLIGFGCVTVVAVATTIAYGTDYHDPGHPCHEGKSYDKCLALTSIERGLMMAVAIIPHGLPFVVMVMMRVGAQEMLMRNALLMKHSAVDYIGATTVICTDKTGTLTEGKMTAKRLFGLCASEGHASQSAEDQHRATAQESMLAFYPLRGLSPNGGLFAARDLSMEAMQEMDLDYQMQEMRQRFGNSELPDLAKPGEEQADVPGVDALLARAHLACGFLSSYATSISRDPETLMWNAEGNLTETAVKVAAAKGGLWDGEGLGAALMSAFPRMSELEVPFTSTRKMMATVHKLPTERRLETLELPQDATHLAVLKGAPDKIASRLKAVLSSDSRVLTLPGRSISEAERTLLEQRNSDLAQEALRSLLVAICALSADDVQRMVSEADADTRLEMLLKHPGLCFVSLWGIYDPPRASVGQSVTECHRAGIRVVMITGDQHPTAVAIGKQVNILSDGDDPHCHASECAALAQFQRRPSADKRRLSEQAIKLLTDVVASGAAIDDESGKVAPEYKSQEELARLTARVKVWARAQPADKVAIVKALTQQLHVTVMTGDGVNDAPALTNAHTGVSMGISGTDVTKNASDLVLMDDDFSTIVAAVREGRRIYANTQKYVLYNFSIKEGELSCLLFAIIFRMPMPIQGLQQLVNLITTHMLPPLVFCYEVPESFVMRVPPRETRRDMIMTQAMVFYRWIPFVLFMASTVLASLSVGLWSHTGFFTGQALIGSSRIGDVRNSLAACEFAGHVDSDGKFQADHAPFHCVCHNHWESDKSDIEQWGIDQPAAAFESGIFASKFDPWTGLWADDLLKQAKTPWANGVDFWLQPCTDRMAVQHWCWKSPETLLTARPLLPPGMHCAAWGARLGQTMSYATIQLGEVLSLGSYRTSGHFWYHLGSNPYYLVALFLNICALLVFLYVPQVSHMLNLAPLTRGRFGVAALFAVSLLLLNELAKVAYRWKLEEKQEKLEAEAAEQAKGHMLPDGRRLSAGPILKAEDAV
mmetsp:Transcript_120747/g.225700  ORF Transcript_120747/g.225700 Transcript_120747/m.225700 type:complete len:1244 (+) Transcript_120747:157-3888(+)